MSGTNLTYASSVTFGDTTTGFTVNSDTALSAYVPASDSGADSVAVRVTSLGGTSAGSPADVYSYVSVPLVSVTPTSGGPATPVTVAGTGFGAAETVKVVYLTGRSLPTSVVICKSPTTAGGTFSCKGKVPGAFSAGSHRRARRSGPRACRRSVRPRRRSP